MLTVPGALPSVVGGQPAAELEDDD